MNAVAQASTVYTKRDAIKVGQHVLFWYEWAEVTEVRKDRILAYHPEYKDTITIRMPDNVSVIIQENQP